MRLTIQPPAWERLRAKLGPRGMAALLALAIEALIIFLLLGLAPVIMSEKQSRPVVFGFDMDSGETAEPKKETKDKASAKSGSDKVRPPTPQPVITTPPEPPEVKVKADVIWLTRKDYAASDIARIPRQGPGPASDPGEAASGAGDSAIAQGRGPNGETLYAADWHVRPTDAQLATYIPDRARQDGWGLIACRTVANYRVEDCQEMADWPRGSGLASAVRQAAWQFRVRPPRVGGRSMVGAWVAIRINYTIIRGK